MSRLHKHSKSNVIIHKSDIHLWLAIMCKIYDAGLVLRIFTITILGNKMSNLTVIFLSTCT